MIGKFLVFNGVMPGKMYSELGNLFTFVKELSHW